MTNGKLILLALFFTGASVVVGGGTAGYVLYREAQEKIGEMPDAKSVVEAVGILSDFENTIRDIGGMEEGRFGRRMEALRARHPFTPAEDGRITEEQMIRFLAVRKAILAVDQEMAEEVKQEEKPSAATLVKWNFFSRMKRLREVQADALETQRMPLEEYRYVHGHVFEAFFAGDKRLTDGGDAGDAVGGLVDGIVREIDAELGNASTTPARREELLRARSQFAQQREALVGLADRGQQRLREVPPENIALVEKYGPELRRALEAGVDLDAIEFLSYVQRTGAERAQ